LCKIFAPEHISTDTIQQCFLRFCINLSHLITSITAPMSCSFVIYWLVVLYTNVKELHLLFPI